MMTKKPILILISCICLALLELWLVVPVFPDAVERLRQDIADQKDLAEESNTQLTRLTEQERKLFKEMAKVEDRIFDLEDRIWTQEQELEAIEKKRRELTDELSRLRGKKDKTIVELNQLLASIWPVHLQHLEARLAGLKTWAMADRRFTWMSRLFAATKDKFNQLVMQTRLISMNILEQDKLHRQAEEKLELVNKDKDQLLEDQLTLLAGIKKVRSEKITKEQELSSILGTIEKLSYKLKTLSERKFTKLKGQLPWPCTGKVIEKYSPRSKPPVRGLGIKMPEDGRVRSIFWGKVVHNDTLRGFGQVVIIYHGQNFYSLYAYLGESDLAMGQEVEKDEVIGTAGYYPPAKGPGLYFELRFRQKAINPVRWLAPRQ